MDSLVIEKLSIPTTEKHPSHMQENLQCMVVVPWPCQTDKRPFDASCVLELRKEKLQKKKEKKKEKLFGKDFENCLNDLQIKRKCTNCTNCNFIPYINQPLAY